MIKDKKRNTHRTYKARRRLTIAVTIVSASSKHLLHKSLIGTSIEDLLPYMISHQQTFLYHIVQHRDF